MEEARVYFEQGLYFEAEETYTFLLKQLEKIAENGDVKATKKLIKEKLKEIERVLISELEKCHLLQNSQPPKN